MSHVDRMKNELSELRVKIDALNVFILESDVYNTLDGVEQFDMVKQLALMEAYEDVLSVRVRRASK